MAWYNMSWFVLTCKTLDFLFTMTWKIFLWEPFLELYCYCLRCSLERVPIYIYLYLKKIPRHSWHDRALPKKPQTESAKMFFLKKRFQRATAYIYRHINVWIIALSIIFNLTISLGVLLKKILSHNTHKQTFYKH